MHGSSSSFASVSHSTANDTSAASAYGLRTFLLPAGAKLDAADRFIGSGGATQSGTHIMHALVPQLSDVLRKLNARIERSNTELWIDRLPPPPGGADPTFKWENPSIPSGYTYLMQLMAHDMVSSAAAVAPSGPARALLKNDRSRPLQLDTLYGSGPDIDSAAYEFSGSVRDSRGVMPRIRLRLGPYCRPRDARTSDCPYRDIGRGVAAKAEDSGRDFAYAKDWLTEAFICDLRNDSHAIIAQLTVLFHLLHNLMVAILEARTVPAAENDTEAAYRRFLAARTAVTLIYRNVIENDLLVRILHPCVHVRYVRERRPLIDPNSGVPLEFTHGAFRFGHAMVRDAYRTNSDRELPMDLGLMLSAMRSPGTVSRADIVQLWMVDWSRFFPTGTLDPNLSRRIGPDYSAAMRNSRLLTDRDKVDGLALPGRDLMSACFVGLWSTNRLYTRLQSEFASEPIAALLPDFRNWSDLISSWALKPAPWPIPNPVGPDDAAVIASDPPLPFFVQFEAAHPITNGVPALGGGGRHLGPLGSIIVAEAVLGAIRDHPLGVEDAGASLKDRLAATGERLLGDQAAFSTVPDIATMPHVLAFMASQGGFAVNA